jgi:glutamyl-tRNA synthetase
MGGRGKTTRELADFSDYFLDFDAVKSRYAAEDITPERRTCLVNFFTALFGKFHAACWEAQHLEEFARSWCDENGASLKEIAMPLRFALSGRKVSPGVFEMASLLGRDECWRRLRHYDFV